MVDELCLWNFDDLDVARALVKVHGGGRPQTEVLHDQLAHRACSLRTVPLSVLRAPLAVAAALEPAHQLEPEDDLGVLNARPRWGASLMICGMIVPSGIGRPAIR